WELVGGGGGGPAGEGPHRFRLEPEVVPVEDATADRVLRDVVVPPESAEQARDLPAGAEAEQLRELGGAGPLGGLLLAHRPGPRDARGHREDLHPDVDGPEEERLLPLQARPVDDHPVEDLPRGLARRALGEAEVPGEAAEAGVARPPTPTEPAGRVPPRVEEADLRERGEPGAEAGGGIDQRPGDLQVPVDRLAR